ncbi:hypothetical protein NDU88_009239 [Pleurodeles waltl]|uniref:Uncharacterized protein n=1 Tax=Pleurodeles waltl TaxID=8319 RepID=A0AAV7PYX1_PLEWA|nr:hypothetical protein NDU88_009239 [Pleurodeles waltl]
MPNSGLRRHQAEQRENELRSQPRPEPACLPGPRRNINWSSAVSAEEALNSATRLPLNLSIRASMVWPYRNLNASV